MFTYDARRTSDSSPDPVAGPVAVQVADGPGTALVHNCSRLGRSANPPGFSFTDWLRDLRRR